MTDFGAPEPNQPAFIRPAILIAPTDPSDWFSNSFLLMPFTTTERDYIASVRIRPSSSNGLAVTSYAQIDMMRTLPVSHCLRHLGVIDPEDWNIVRYLTAQYMGFAHA